MTKADLTADGEISAKAHRIYDERVKGTVEPVHRGEFLTLNVDTGEYELGPDDVTVVKRARNRFPEGTLFTFRIGYDAAHTLGGGFQIEPR